MGKRNIEGERFALQLDLDSQKQQLERNKLGQFSTPYQLAAEIMEYAGVLLPANEKISFLDPAIGTGVFYSALTNTFPAKRIAKAQGFEIDPHYANPAIDLWHGSELSIQVADFTHSEPSGKFNLLICNPPYVRHHHLKIEDKPRLKQRTYEASGMGLSGLSGLYCYFMGLASQWLAKGAISCWLVPSEFMDVNYGMPVKHYLLERVTLLRIHRFDPNETQFTDALVSSAVVYFKNEAPRKDHCVAFSFGSTISKPAITKDISAEVLRTERKWTRFPSKGIRIATPQEPVLSDFFQIKRGIATGDNGFFILNEETISARHLPWEVFKPVLPSPRYLKEDRIPAYQNGNPMLDQKLFLLDIRISEEAIEEQYPTLWQYLQEGRNKGLNEQYICRHRSMWYLQENRPAPPIVCTYLGRSDNADKRPFRFILNDSKATVTNSYLAMYPKPLLARMISEDATIIAKIWQLLNNVPTEALLGEGRVYGGGLHKLEPKELANVPLAKIWELLGAAN